MYTQEEVSIISDYVKAMPEKEYIRTSSPNILSLINLVKKKSGETRVCIDYRGVKAATITDIYLVLIIE
jgi:hypothetical protein